MNTYWGPDFGALRDTDPEIADGCAEPGRAAPAEIADKARALAARFPAYPR
jgi:hypothetical protein